ncbi:bifunctional metallophosphatase/5'-nucleotidase [Firmicutes bacterium OM07-11]|nr:bifunctional metallophosphatase/5'-nucleotidase [Firmicutes bacterium OM07-11]
MKQLQKQRKKIMSLLLIFGIVFGLLGVMPVYAQDENASESTTFDVKIVHTNDIHARVEEDDYNQVIGMDRLSKIAQTFTAGADGSLMLDSGDIFHGQPIATLVQGESVAKLMKSCGYDAMTAGNHDWSYGKDRLKELGGIANVKILSGNIKNVDGTSFFDTDALVKEITKNGKILKIGVFGVSDPNMKDKTTPSNVEGLEFQDAIAYANMEAAAIKADGCDVVIALSHTLNPKNLAAQVDCVDLWLCGHEHIELSETVTTPNRSKAYVSESGYYLNTVGLIDLNCTLDADGSVHVDYNKTSVNYEAAQNYPKDASVTAILDEIKAENETALNRVIGTSPVELDGVWEHIRIGQTNLGNVITDAYLLATGTDIAFENAGGIRASVAAGTITYGDIINVSPYGNYVVTKKLTGAQIKNMLETSLTIQKNCIAANDSGEWDAWPNDSGSYLQVGGITVSFDPAQPEGSRVLSVKKDGQELDNTKEYIVAVNNYLAGSDSYPALAEAAEIGEYSCCEELLSRFFEQGSDAIAASASKQNMIQTTKESTEPVPPTTPETPSVPVTPAIPEQPAKEQPKSPKTEVKKDDAGRTKASAKNPKTGDDNTLLCWMLLLLLSGSVGSICLVQKNKK